MVARASPPSTTRLRRITGEKAAVKSVFAKRSQSRPVKPGATNGSEPAEVLLSTVLWPQSNATLTRPAYRFARAAPCDPLWRRYSFAVLGLFVYRMTEQPAYPFLPAFADIIASAVCAGAASKPDFHRHSGRMGGLRSLGCPGEH
jgi:hypothetical protein